MTAFASPLFTAARLAIMLAALGAICGLGLPASASARATSACGPDALGTARVLAVDARTTPRVGQKQFPQTLPLADHEVVLTFDDGPMPATTPRVLTALADQCVRASFFLVGRNAAAAPALVQRIAREGHTIGHHSYSHPILSRIGFARALKEIDRGVAANEQALHGHNAAMAIRTPATPFFRFPGFAHNPALLAEMERRQFVVFGADLWASDWNFMTPDQELRLVTSRLEAAGRGIILFHDTRAQSVAMIPAFLRWLKAHHFRIVHVVVAGAAR